MNLMQYVGNKPLTKYTHAKVFVNITNLFMKIHDQNLQMLTESNVTFTPIHPDTFNDHIGRVQFADRYEVTPALFGKVFQITENFRDACPKHLPGFVFISLLKVGDIIPLTGFTMVEALSDDDAKILSSGMKLEDYMRPQLSLKERNKMRNLYQLDKDDQNNFNILDPDGGIIFTDKNKANLGLLVMYLNNRTRDNYEVRYHYDNRDRIISSNILVDGDDVFLEFKEANCTKEEETRGYGIVTHLNREHSRS